MTRRIGEHAHDPAYVRERYASEANLAARASLYGEITGTFAGDVAFVVFVADKQ